MNYLTKQQVQERVTALYEHSSQYGEVYGVFLKGSQNYTTNLFHGTSDVDVVAVIMPTTRDILLGEDNNTKPTVELENGEQIVLQDFRKFMKMFKKASITHVECLTTEYFKVNPKYEAFHKTLVEKQNFITRSFVKEMALSIHGFFFKNEKRLFTKQCEDVENFGYSRKGLSHLFRLERTLNAYLEGKEIKDCLKALDEKELFKYKYELILSLDEVYSLVEKLKLSMGKMKQTLPANEKEKEENLEKLNHFVSDYTVMVLESLFK